MTTPTQGEHAQTAAQVQRYKIGYPTDSWGERSSTPSGIPDHAGAWVRYEDHAAQVAALTAAPADADNLRKALQFYADGHHFTKSDGDAWGTVSGEPQNYWCDEAGTATVEDGSIAKLALAGHPIKFEDEDATPRAAPQGVAYAELPARRRAFLCTKCGGRECEPGTLWQTHPPCKCGYLGFAEDLDFTADDMRDFADRTHALRIASHGQAPAGAAVGVVRWAAGIEGSQLEVRWKDGAAPPAGTQVYTHTPTAQAAPAAERQYINGVKTVADLVNNLLLLDQLLPIYAAQHIQIANRRRTITVPPTVSLERVKDERWIGEGDELNAAVIWTRAEAPAAGAVAGAQHELDGVIAECEHGLPFDATSLATLKRVRDSLAAAPTPAAQADSVTAPANTRQIAECYGDCPTDPKTCANPCKFEGRASRTPAKAAPAADPAYSEACSLATALFEKHYRQEPDYASGRVVWSLCDTTAGVISQIDNMVSGLARAPAAGAVAGPGEVAALRMKAVQACATANGRDWEFMYSGHQDDQVDAWLDGYSAGQAAPQGAAYAELPESYQSSTLIVGNDGCTVTFHFGTGDEADVESWLSAVTERASHGQAPAAGAVAGPTWKPLQYATPRDLWNAFKGGTKFVLHYHGKALPVERMGAREHVVYVQPPGMPLKVYPDGRNCESAGDAIWLEELAAAPTPAAQADSVLEDAARLAKITQAIRDYHFALDNREHGGVAMARAWNAICDVLNMDWVQGAESAARKQGGTHD